MEHEVSRSRPAMRPATAKAGAGASAIGLRAAEAETLLTVLQMSCRFMAQSGFYL